MAENTKIEWADHSASPWHGCSEVHAGCDNCYARTMAKRNPGTLGVWGKDGTRVMSASFAKNCRRWNADAKERGVIETVFPSICDIFEDWQGPILNAKGERLWHLYPPSRTYVTMDDIRRDTFGVIDECQNLRFLLLTKRPENVRRKWPKREIGCRHCVDSEFMAATCGTCGATGFVKEPRPLKNVAVITSVSDQATADAMIPELLKCRGLVPTLGVSLEPMLGPVDLARWLVMGWCSSCQSNCFILHGTCRGCGGNANPFLSWVIVGGESGHGARPCRLEWIRLIRDQCKEAGVACFIKQLGSNPIDEEHFAKASAWFKDHWGFAPSLAVQIKECTFQLKDSKGGDISEWPEDLKVRQYPKWRQA